MTRICTVLLLTLLTLPVRLGAQVADATGPGPDLVRTEQRVGPFSFGGEEITVVLEQVSVPAGRDTTVARIRIVDGQGRVHFDEEHGVDLSDEGELAFVHEGYPSVVEFSGGRLLSLSEGFYPSAPQSGVSWRLFAWQDGSIRPVSGPIGGYGGFVSLPTDSSSGIERLLPGDLFYFDAWVYHFAVRVPIAIRPEGVTVEERVRVVAGQTNGLAVLTTFNAKRDVDRVSGPEVVMLYDAPTGSTGRRVVVTGETEIEFGPAFVNLSLSFGGSNDHVSIGANVVRLQVRIDGQVGFVEQSDFDRMGMRSAG